MTYIRANACHLPQIAAMFAIYRRQRHVCLLPTVDSSKCFLSAVDSSKCLLSTMNIVANVCYLPWILANVCYLQWIAAYLLSTVDSGKIMCSLSTVDSSKCVCCLPQMTANNYVYCLPKIASMFVAYSNSYQQIFDLLPQKSVLTHYIFFFKLEQPAYLP